MATSPAVRLVESVMADAVAAERARIKQLADQSGADYMTGVNGHDACDGQCEHVRPTNPAVTGRHWHPFSALLGESARHPGTGGPNPDADLCARCGDQFPADQICRACPPDEYDRAITRIRQFTRIRQLENLAAEILGCFAEACWVDVPQLDQWRAILDNGV